MPIDEVARRRRWKRGIFSSVIRSKCPRCREGNLFSVSNPYNLKRVLDMPESCPACGQDFQIEPGFYSGAPFMSYPLVLLIGVPLFLFETLFLDLALAPAIGITLAALLAVQPVLMRFGRVVWLYLFVPKA